MSEQRRFGESDHEPLQQDDVLTQAISEWRDELPTRDLWAGISTRIASIAAGHDLAPRRRSRCRSSRWPPRS